MLFSCTSSRSCLSSLLFIFKEFLDFWHLTHLFQGSNDLLPGLAYNMSKMVYHHVLVHTVWSDGVVSSKSFSLSSSFNLLAPDVLPNELELVKILDISMGHIALLISKVLPSLSYISLVSELRYTSSAILLCSMMFFIDCDRP